VVEALPDSVLNNKPRQGLPQRRKARNTAGKHKPKPSLPLTLDSFSPQLATLVMRRTAGGDWLYEIKFDGYRLLTRIDGDDVRCFTRNGHDWSHRLPSLVKAIKALKMRLGLARRRDRRRG
jgi:bifunctional non-homologous end joining protein LigD